MNTLIIIPAYNEEESLESTVSRLIATVPDVDYLVVNDGSSDGTVQICRENGYPFLDLPCNLGLAGAFQAGIKYAYRHSYDCAIQFDADGQHPRDDKHDHEARQIEIRGDSRRGAVRGGQLDRQMQAEAFQQLVESA